MNSGVSFLFTEREKKEVRKYKNNIYFGINSKCGPIFSYHSRINKFFRNSRVSATT